MYTTLATHKPDPAFGGHHLRAVLGKTHPIIIRVRFGVFTKSGLDTNLSSVGDGKVGVSTTYFGVSVPVFSGV